jgi:4-hydroxybenzoate polyprenyltransferase
MLTSLIISALIFSTVHLQDMLDQPGDAKRGRRTVPLVWGDGVARWTIAIPILGWGVWCPIFWRESHFWSLLTVAMACVVAVHTLVIRDVPGDKHIFRLRNS